MFQWQLKIFKKTEFDAADFSSGFVSCCFRPMSSHLALSPPQTWALDEGMRGTATAPTLSSVRKIAKSLRDQPSAFPGLAKFIAKRSDRETRGPGEGGGERKGVEPAEGTYVSSESKLKDVLII